LAASFVSYLGFLNLLPNFQPALQRYLSNNQIRLRCNFFLGFWRDAIKSPQRKVLVRIFVVVTEFPELLEELLASSPAIPLVHAVCQDIRHLDTRRHKRIAKEGSWNYVPVSLAPAVAKHEVVKAYSHLPVGLVVNPIEEKDSLVGSESRLHEGVDAPDESSVEPWQTVAFTRQWERSILHNRERDGTNFLAQSNKLCHKLAVLWQHQRSLVQQEATLQFQIIGSLDLPKMPLQIKQL
jgi:hypothetical protein